MNCKRVEDLLPLYVGSDLEPEQAVAVLAHLNACGRCRMLAADYDESRELLRSYTPPEFGEPFFDRLRASALKQIERNNERPAFFRLVADAWTRKPLVAAAVALLIIFSAIGFYSYYGRSQEQPDQMAKGQSNGGAPSPVPVEEGKEEKSFSERVERRVAIKRPRSKQLQATRRKREMKSKDMLASRPLPQERAIERLPAHELTASQEMLRIEMQTSDPSIRIIWLAPKNNNPNTSKAVGDTD